MTNVCQILAPIFGLLLVYALKAMGSSNMEILSGRSLYLPVPFIFNIPYKPFSSLGQYFNISECHQWYMYQFAENVDEQSKEFWGHNEGLPMENPESRGMINGKTNILEYPC